MQARVGQDSGGDEEGGRTGSVWVAVTADTAALDDLDTDRWKAPDDRRVAWTDTFSNIVSVVTR